MTSNDIFSNLANGRLVLAGLNPYIDPPLALGSDHPTVSLVADDWSDVPTPYGPVITALATLAALARTDWAALAVFKLMMLASVLGTVLVAHACCRTYLPPRQAAAALVFVGWNPLVAWEISGQAHNDGVMLLATTIFAWAAWRRKPWTAVLSIAIAFYAKLAVAPVLGLYLVYQARELAPRRGDVAGRRHRGRDTLGVLLARPRDTRPPPGVAEHAGRSSVRLPVAFCVRGMALLRRPGGCWFFNCGWPRLGSDARGSPAWLCTGPIRCRE